MKKVLNLLLISVFLVIVGQYACAMDSGSKRTKGCIKKSGVLSRSLKPVLFDPELEKRLEIKRNLKLVTFYIEHNQDVNEIKLRDGRSFLHFVAACGDVILVERLLRANAVLDAVDEHGQTALHVAAECGYADVVKLLLYKGARFDLVDMNGFTSLKLAEYKGHPDVVAVILDWQINGMAIIK
ncbi:MAG: ankyrin repeat domain protein [Candidatus Peregrinibacteria bacterium GW2011_GWE2_39_6]|nr:MAG: hypothetical protein US49_C0001G0083 [candidate division TM6 bacterium GW2011_GWF2_37_49]KKR26013.1 MAG: ankyrin repeat domain protein [Candidatus Peregrinibacteria bacterium GW2011_GWE2_39_6]